MDKYLIRSSSETSLRSKRGAEDQPEWRTTKRPTKDSSRYDRQRSIDTHNRFDQLPIDDDSEEVNSLYHEATTSVKKVGHIPPIILELKPDWTHGNLKDLIGKCETRYHMQYRGRNKVAIICYTPEAHEAVKDLLRKEDISFITYTRKDEKTPKVVIQGLPSYAEDQLADELEKLGFGGALVTRLKSANHESDNRPPLFLVQLPLGADVARFRQIKYLLQCVVTVKKFMPRRPAGTQCFRCQQFGHSARNCNMPARCVKCTANHATSACPKQDRKEPARCCNCKEEHPANYRQCSARLAYVQKLQRRRELQRAPKPSIQTLKNIPIRPGIRSWADIASEQSNQQQSQPAAPKESPAALPVINVIAPDISSPDQTTKEMLDILLVIKKLKDHFNSCQSMLDKVMLVLTHLAQYI